MKLIFMRNLEIENVDEKFLLNQYSDQKIVFKKIGWIFESAEFLTTLTQKFL